LVYCTNLSSTRTRCRLMPVYARLPYIMTGCTHPLLNEDGPELIFQKKGDELVGDLDGFTAARL
jgi:hypothetical protein